MKKLILMLLLMLLFSVPVRADSVYSEQCRSSGVSTLPDALPPDAANLLEQDEIDLSSPEWIAKITPKSVFGHITEFLKNGAKAPLAAGGVSVALILITAAFPEERRSSASVRIAGTLAVALTFAVSLISSVQAAASAVKGCGAFMLSFLPVFSGVCILSGGSLTGVTAYTTLMLAAQITVSLASHVILPLTGCYLAMHLCAGVSPLPGPEQTAESIRRVAVWGLTFIVTVFVGILGIQTAVQASADSLTVKTTKFLVGTAVPVAGAALAEATSTLRASLSLLRSSVGVFGVVGIAAVLLPVIAELLLWRVSAAVCEQAAALFAQSSLHKLFKAVNQMVSLLITILLLTGAVFIISLSVVLTALRTL